MDEVQELPLGPAGGRGGGSLASSLWQPPLEADPISSREPVALHVCAAVHCADVLAAV
jgi:hypothetical protein